MPTGPLDILGPEKPLCPPNYSFDYDWQSCWPDGEPHRKPQPGELWRHACNCPAGESWIATEADCWERGSIPFGHWTPSGGLSDTPRVHEDNCEWRTPSCLQRTDQSTVNSNVRLHVSGVGGSFPGSNDAVEGLIREAADLALAYALRAKHFLQHLVDLPISQQIDLWNFGDVAGNALSPSLFARSSAPSYWFGAFSSGLAHFVLGVMDKLATRFSHGHKVLGHYHPFHIVFSGHCAFQFKAIANHNVFGWIELCPRILDLINASPALFLPGNFGADRVGGLPGLALVLFHEMTHQLDTDPLLRDIKGANGPLNARQLILDGDSHSAKRNIENYAHWAAASFIQLGDCEVFDIDTPDQSCVPATGEPGMMRCCVDCLDRSMAKDCRICPYLTSVGGCF